MKILTTFNSLTGKTIKSVNRMQLTGYDDEGFLKLTFTDDTFCVVEGGYSGDYTGDSEDEYQTLIGLAGEERFGRLINKNEGVVK